MTIHYPLEVVKPSGQSLTSMPVSPLVRKPDPRPDITLGKEPSRPCVTIQCLFTPVASLSDMRAERIKAEVGGWVRETTALARVVGSEVELGPGVTVFDGCDYVDVGGSRHKVLNVTLQAASTTAVGTYYVLLSGAAKQ